MTVSTLIANLQQFPPDTEVRITIAGISKLRIDEIAVGLNDKGITYIEMEMGPIP